MVYYSARTDYMRIALDNFLLLGKKGLGMEISTDGLICVASILGIVAVIIFLCVHSDEKRRFVGRVFVVSGFIGLCFHVYSISAQSNIIDPQFDIIAGSYFVVIVYFFCCYLHFSNLPLRRGKSTKKQIKPGRALPESFLDGPRVSIE